MDDWAKHKKNAKKTNPGLAQDIAEAEKVSAIVGAMIRRRHALDLTQRELASLCGLPQSSLARIESGRSSPNLATLLKIFRHLRLDFSITPA